MTPEKTIETAYNIAAAHDPESYKFFRENWREFIGSKNFTVFGYCAAMILDATETLDKKAGNGGKLAAAKRLIKECGTRENMRGVWLDRSGRYCMCNGFAAVRMAEQLNGVPTVPGWDGLPRVMEAPEKYTRRVDMPAASTLKEIVAAWKATKNNSTRPVYDFGDGLPGVDARYLLDMAALLPGAVVTVSSEYPLTTAIYFKAENGDDGILMPVRKEAAKK